MQGHNYISLEVQKQILQYVKNINKIDISAIQTKEDKQKLYMLKNELMEILLKELK